MVHNLFNIMLNTTNSGNLEIRRVPQSRLLKKEMADYAERTIGIVKKHNYESSMINLVFNNLLAKKRYIEILRLDYGIDTERFKIYKRKSKLNLNVSAFKLKVRLLSKDSPEMDLNPLDNAINKHLRYLDKAKNDKELTQKVAGFLDVVEANEDVQAIITKLDVLDDVMVIGAALSHFVDAVEKRIELLAQRPATQTRDVGRIVFGAIENLFKAIEVSYLLSKADPGTTNPDAPAEDNLNYVTLISELNQLYDSFYRSIMIRQHNNKRKAKQKEMEGGEGAESDIDNSVADGVADGTPEVDAPETQTTSFRNDEMEGEHEGELNDEFDQDLNGESDIWLVPL